MLRRLLWAMALLAQVCSGAIPALAASVITCPYDARARCFQPTSGDPADSPVFDIFYTSSICLQPDTATTGADATVVEVLRCQISGATGNQNGCAPVITDAQLTGAAGDTCMYDVPAGKYYLRVVTAPGAGDTTVVEIREQR